VTRKRFFIAFAAVTLLIASLGGFVASASPDGLERVARDHGVAAAQKEPPAGDAPLADFGVKGVDSSGLASGLAGVLGVGVVLVLAGSLAYAVRRRHDRTG
jgi:cobalt/nickel transport system permease protein